MKIPNVPLTPQMQLALANLARAKAQLARTAATASRQLDGARPRPGTTPSLEGPGGFHTEGGDDDMEESEP